jgi:hypothetical protein
MDGELFGSNVFSKEVGVCKAVSGTDGGIF